MSSALSKELRGEHSVRGYMLSVKWGDLACVAAGLQSSQFDDWQQQPQKQGWVCPRTRMDGLAGYIADMLFSSITNVQ